MSEPYIIGVDVARPGADVTIYHPRSGFFTWKRRRLSKAMAQACSPHESGKALK